MNIIGYLAATFLLLGSALGSPLIDPSYPPDVGQYEVIKVKGLHGKMFEMALSIVEEHQLDVWSARHDLEEMDVMVKKEEKSLFGKFNVSVVHDNIQSVLDQSKIVEWNGEDDFYNDYRSYAQSTQRLTQLCSAHSSLCTTFVLGKTVEGRDIVGVHINGGNGGKEIVINGNIHAREWVTPMTVLYAAEQLLTQYDSNGEVKNLVDKFRWTIVPCLNVDGRIHTETTYRMWRKNRSRNQGGSFGVDLNRNFDYMWNRGGSSSNPSSDTFHGIAALSEPEAAAIRNYVCSQNENGNVAAYFDIHTHGNMFLTPYGWSNTRPTDLEEILRFGKVGVDAIEGTNGARWKLGTTYSVLYHMSGGSLDAMYGSCGVVYSYLLELRGPGFNPPPNNIILSCTEIFNGFLAMGNELDSM